MTVEEALEKIGRVVKKWKERKATNAKATEEIREYQME